MNDHIEQKLLHGYLDGEVDLDRNLKVEDHLRDCQFCSHDYRKLLALRQAVRTQLPYYDAPPRLRGRIDAMLGQAAKAKKPPVRPLRLWPWMGLGAGASLAFALMMFWVLGTNLVQTPAEKALAGDVLSSHVRSLMAGHLTDVPSSNSHTVKPWFNGKLDFSPTVKDLAEAGYPLVGGRLDYIGNRPAAALVFGRRQHLINLFTWPAQKGKDHTT